MFTITTPAASFSFPTPRHNPRRISLSSPRHLSLSSRPPLRLTSATSDGGDGSNNNGRITGGGGGGGDGGKGRNRKRYEPLIYGSLADQVIELYDRVHVDISYACIMSLAYIFAFLWIGDIFLHVIGFHAYCENIEKEKENANKCKCCNTSYGKAVGGST